MSTVAHQLAPKIGPADVPKAWGKVHGGRAEEAFQGLMDQKLSEQLTEATADKFAEPMFRRQFPQLAAQESKVDTTAFRSDSSASLSQLEQLSRR
jgi:hypothetical protein